MNEIPPIRIIEPSVGDRRRQVSGTLIGASSAYDLEAARSRLKDLRESSLRDHVTLIGNFKKSVTDYPDIDLRVASDANAATDHIAEISGDCNCLAINRSGVVTNELKSALEERGFNIVQPYYAEFDSFEPRIDNYWDLPDLLGKGITGSFEVTAHSMDFGMDIATGDTPKDFVAVLGVNAASAGDGSIFFLQHSSNISKSLEQSRKVVLIVALDKLVPTRDDAEFQTKCMGVFGLESALLNLRPRKIGSDEIQGLPDSPAPRDRKLHIILLDNGRSSLLKTDYSQLLRCIGCKACIKQCPISRPLSIDGTVWSPRDYLLKFLQGKIDSIDMCLHCEACRVECPLDIDIPRLMWMAQADHAIKHGRKLRDRIMGNPQQLAKFGSFTAPVANLITNLEPGRTLVTSMLGLDRNRALPKFQRQTFMRWFAGRKANSREPGAKRKIAYFMGCFANYYQVEVARALVNVMERNGFEVLVPDQKCCGLPMMAGMNIAGAQANALHNIESLASVTAKGYDIITTCPSCNLMIKREYLALFESDETRLVSDHLFLADEYLTQLARKGQIKFELKKTALEAFYHIPCHLKAQDAMKDSLELMQLIPGLSLTNVNTACCGMAGYHGYKKEHARLSVEMGMDLFRKKHALAEHDNVITSCAACKSQIEACTGAMVMHPIVLLSQLYGTAPEPAI
ncbi:MAG: anaerobic glycerol-3-phosphate dehydrogenase subunit C [Chloroflexi bacterium]|nr:anaerobic glycerol-3-phosphate dehydrogenase subunit C [Chloroflexota bacterium]